MHIEFTDGEDKIVVEGPPEEVEQAYTALQDLTKDLVRGFARVHSKSLKKDVFSHFFRSLYKHPV